MQTTERITVTITRSQAAQLRRLHQATGLPVSRLVAGALTQMLSGRGIFLAPVETETMHTADYESAQEATR